MDAVDAVGWTASLVLFLTLGRQVWVQWRERSTAGLSGWLFLGQISASTGFIVYSVLLENPVFVVSNAFILAIAVCGQLIYRRNRRLGPGPEVGAGAVDERRGTRPRGPSPS